MDLNINPVLPHGTLVQHCAATRLVSTPGVFGGGLCSLPVFLVRFVYFSPSPHLPLYIFHSPIIVSLNSSVLPQKEQLLKRPQAPILLKFHP